MSQQQGPKEGAGRAISGVILDRAGAKNRCGNDLGIGAECIPCDVRIKGEGFVIRGGQSAADLTADNKTALNHARARPARPAAFNAQCSGKKRIVQVAKPRRLPCQCRPAPLKNGVQLGVSIKDLMGAVGRAGGRAHAHDAFVQGAAAHGQIGRAGNPLALQSLNFLAHLSFKRAQLPNPGGSIAASGGLPRASGQCGRRGYTDPSRWAASP